MRNTRKTELRRREAFVFLQYFVARRRALCAFNKYMPSQRTLLISLVCLVLVFVLWGWIFFNRVERQLNLASNTPALLLQIQKMNELVTVKYSIQKVVGLEEQKQPFGREKLLLIVQAKVGAGIDVGRLQKVDLSSDGKGAYVVRLPAAQILYVAIDERETKVWDRQVTWWTPWVPYNVDLERQARVLATEEIKKSAIGMGILNDARRQAEVAIRNLLQVFGVTDIKFRDAS